MAPEHRRDAVLPPPSPPGFCTPPLARRRVPTTIVDHAPHPRRHHHRPCQTHRHSRRAPTCCQPLPRRQLGTVMARSSCARVHTSSTGGAVPRALRNSAMRTSPGRYPICGKGTRRTCRSRPSARPHAPSTTAGLALGRPRLRCHPHRDRHRPRRARICLSASNQHEHGSLRTAPGCRHARARTSSSIGARRTNRRPCSATRRSASGSTICSPAPTLTEACQSPTCARPLARPLAWGHVRSSRDRRRPPYRRRRRLRCPLSHLSHRAPIDSTPSPRTRCATARARASTSWVMNGERASRPSITAWHGSTTGSTPCGMTVATHTQPPPPPRSSLCAPPRAQRTASAHVQWTRVCPPRK